jgi:ribosomal protein S18 acetylase RimI-like enzyme
MEMVCSTARFEVTWTPGLACRPPRVSDIPALTVLDHEGMTAEEVTVLRFPGSVQRFFNYIRSNANEDLSLRASSVVLAGDTIIGFCLFIAEHGHEAHLYNIHVAVARRREGLATRMIQRGMTVLASAYPRVDLEGVEEGDAAYQCYSELGFVPRPG